MVLISRLSFFLFAAVWSWTSSSRRTSYSRWWRGFALPTTPTSPPCLTPRRPSPPPRNASPKPTPRSTPAGNFGSFENRRITHPATGAQDLCIRLLVKYLIVYPSSFLGFLASLWLLFLNLFFFFPLVDQLWRTAAPLDTELLFRDDRMFNGKQMWIPWENRNVTLTKNGFRFILN